MIFITILLLTFSQPPSQSDASVAKLPDLQQELLSRFKMDQDARFALVNFMAKHKLGGSVKTTDLEPALRKEYETLHKKVQDIDKDDLAWLKEIVVEHGWPGKSLVGKAGADAAWLLVQHADTDRDFQEMCLKKMEGMAKGEVEGQHIAYLTDRVLVGRGKKQLYGTQGKWENGKMVASPIDDETHVDERRKKAGLAPLAEYLQQLNKVYTQPEPMKKEEKKTGPDK